jgi:hypothetical protein
MADMQKELKFHSALLNHWRTIQILQYRQSRLFAPFNSVPAQILTVPPILNNLVLKFPDTK